MCSVLLKAKVTIYRIFRDYAGFTKILQNKFTAGVATSLIVIAP